jgi:drug/metabolite transporter (DMT)-like permease
MIGDPGVIPAAALPTWICGIIGGLLFVAGLVFMQSSIKINGATLTSAFGKLGVMVPLAMSLLIFGEKPALVQVAGILVAISALVVINSPSKDESSKAATYSFALLILTFLGNGLADSMAKVFEHIGSRADDRIYIFFVFASACLITAVLAYVEYKKTSKKIIPKELLAGIAVGIPNYYSSFFLLGSVERLPSFLVYPIFSTGTILLVMVVSTLIFRERPSKTQYIGIAMILAALVLLNL